MAAHRSPAAGTGPDQREKRRARGLSPTGTRSRFELARGIQRSFLPTSFPPSPRFEVHAVNVPSRGGSGDFCDVVSVGDSLLLAIADVEGKSVPAAFLTAMLQASLRTQTEWVPSVAEMVANVNTLASWRFSSSASFFLSCEPPTRGSRQ